MGPEIDQIEGRLVERDTADYLVAVTAVHLLRGGDQIWSGEQVHIKPAYVSRSYERRFSPGRTVVLSAIGVAVVAAFVSQTLIGSGNDNSATGGDSSGATVRIPVGRHRLPHLGRP
jgi:hypothetical protein